LPLLDRKGLNERLLNAHNDYLTAAQVHGNAR
jgi:hypothetical protein